MVGNPFYEFDVIRDQLLLLGRTVRALYVVGDHDAAPALASPPETSLSKKNSMAPEG